MWLHDEKQQTEQADRIVSALASLRSRMTAMAVAGWLVQAVLLVAVLSWLMWVVFDRLEIVERSNRALWIQMDVVTGASASNAPE